MDSGPLQVFIRDEKGKTWGPLELSTVTLLLENGLVEGRVEVSQDGIDFTLPGRLPGIRDAFPRELWGDGAAPSPRAEPTVGDEASSSILLGGEETPVSAPARPPSGAAPIAGPGAMHRATTGNAPIAGPGAVAVAAAREGRASGPRAATEPRHGVASSVPAVATLRPGAPPNVTQTAPHAPSPVSSRSPTTPSPVVPTPARPAQDAPASSPMPAHGELAQVSPMHLFYLAGSSDQTGLLTLSLPDRSIEIHFRKGNPEYVASSHVEDSVAGFLLKQGLANAEQINQAEAAKDRFGGELTGALFGLGTLNPGTAFSQLAQRALGLLMKAMLAESGAFRFEVKELAAHRAMPLGNRWGVLSDVVRRIPQADLRRRLQAVADLPVMKSGGRIQATELRLTPQEARAVSFIDGVRSLSQLWHDYAQEAEVFARVVFLLDKLELVSFAAVPVRTAAPSPPADAPSPVAPPSSPAAPAAGSAVKVPPRAVAPAPTKAAPPVAKASPPPVKPAPVPAEPPPPPVSPEVELAELRVLAAKVKTQNHFELLGLTDKADAGAIKISYFKLAKLHHPDTVSQNALPELHQLKSEVFGAIGQAYRTLSDDKARALYVDELKHGSEKIDVAQILLAEDLFQRGSIMVKARKFPEAVKALDEAIKANGEEPEFYAWRGFAKFFQIPDKAVGKTEALKDINYCLKKNERVAPAHYFLGQISKLTGDNVTAVKHFRRATELNPSYTDAQRELRMLDPKK